MKNLSLLTFGSLFSQLISFLLSPIISRLYNDFQMGQYTLLLTMISLFSGVGMGRFDLAIVSESEHNNVRALVKLSKIILLFTSPILTVISLIYINVKGERLIPYSLFIVVILLLFLLNGLVLLYSSILNREKKYRELSLSNILNVMVKNVATVLMGFTKFTEWGLIFPLILGLVVQVVYLHNSFGSSYKKTKDIGTDLLKNVTHLYNKQVIYSVPANLAMNFSSQANNLFINMLYGTSMLGQFGFTHRILALPISLISSNVSKVYFETVASEYNEQGTYLNAFKKTTVFLLLTGLGIGLGIFILGPTLISWFLGPEWELSSVMSRYMAPLYTIRYIVAPLTMGTIISGKQKLELQMQLLFVLGEIISYIFSRILSLTVLQYILFSSILSSVLYIIYFIRLYKLAAICKDYL